MNIDFSCIVKWCFDPAMDHHQEDGNSPRHHLPSPMLPDLYTSVQQTLGALTCQFHRNERTAAILSHLSSLESLEPGDCNGGYQIAFFSSLKMSLSNSRTGRLWQACCFFVTTDTISEGVVSKKKSIAINNGSGFTTREKTNVPWDLNAQSKVHMRNNAVGRPTISVFLFDVYSETLYCFDAFCFWRLWVKGAFGCVLGVYLVELYVECIPGTWKGVLSVHFWAMNIG